MFKGRYVDKRWLYILVTYCIYYIVEVFHSRCSCESLQNVTVGFHLSINIIKSYQKNACNVGKGILVFLSKTTTTLCDEILTRRDTNPGALTYSVSSSSDFPIHKPKFSSMFFTYAISCV